MQIVWLGQGGLMLVSKKNKILVDPYMSNALKKVDKGLKRKVRVRKKFFKLKPDVIVLTNCHPDHTDMKTLSKFLKKKKTGVTVLSCENSFKELISTKDCNKANHIMFGEGDEWSLNTLHIKAIKARTDDRTAFGLLITDSTDGKKYYIASNTLYNEAIIDEIPKELYAAFIPISGTYGCMNTQDAERFAKRLDADFVVPINYGMFDTLDPDNFKCLGKVVPKPFRAIEFNILSVQSLFAPKVFDRKFNEKEAEKVQEEKEQAADSQLKPTVQPVIEPAKQPVTTTDKVDPVAEIDLSKDL